MAPAGGATSSPWSSAASSWAPLGRVDPVTERGVHDDHDLGARVLGQIGADGLVQLGQARDGPTLGGQVGAVHDDMVGALSSRPQSSIRRAAPGDGETPVQPIARLRRSACSSWCWPALPVAGLADSGRLTWMRR